MANVKQKVCAVVGVGPGNGEALARRFCADGYAVALLARRTDLTARLAAELPAREGLRLRRRRRRLGRRRVRWRAGGSRRR